MIIMDKRKEYYESLDRRSKEYKAYKQSLTEPKGLGDVIETITKKTGIKALVEFVAGEDCGCKERKEKLNAKYPIRVKPQRCFTEQNYNDYKVYYETRTLNSWSDKEEVQMLIDLYAHVFAIQYKISNLCVTCQGSARILKTISDRLDKVYLSYNKK